MSTTSTLYLTSPKACIKRKLWKLKATSSEPYSLTSKNRVFPNIQAHVKIGFYYSIRKLKQASTTKISLEDVAPVQELVKLARENSPYDRRRYENVPENISDLSQLPTVDHTTFWDANTDLPPEDRVLNSSSLIDGAVSRIGGTTANPKASLLLGKNSEKEPRAGPTV